MRKNWYNRSLALQMIAADKERGMDVIPRAIWQMQEKIQSVTDLQIYGNMKQVKLETMVTPNGVKEGCVQM